MHSGFLRLTDEEHRLACVSDADFPKTARVLFEYGAEKEGYWTSEKFMTNIVDAAKIASFKYPSEKHTVMFIFDQSSCHRVFGEDALNVNRMNVRPGGMQPAMHDTMWGGRVQTMIDADGVPKGMKKVLEEHGINTSRMVADDMKVVLAIMKTFARKRHLLSTIYMKKVLKLSSYLSSTVN